MPGSTSSKPIITASALLALKEHMPFILLDARSGKDAQERYQRGHLEGAFHVDLDKNLAAHPDDPSKGGRHPLPDPVTFGNLLGSLGIEPATTVVVYDDKAGSNAAARLWWMLKAAGHQQVFVIDGGIEAAEKAGYPVSETTPTAKPVSAYAINWESAVVDISKVEQAAKDPHALVIDVREAYRYNGESEPIDTIAGHIPGAVNMPYVNNLNQDGTFLSSEMLKEKYENAIGSRKKENIIVHCGSGVTACHTLLAMEQAGISGPKLYVGSWSEWSRTGRPIAKGPQQS